MFNTPILLIIFNRPDATQKYLTDYGKSSQNFSMLQLIAKDLMKYIWHNQDGLTRK